MFERSSKEKTPAKNSELGDMELFSPSSDSETSLTHPNSGMESEENQPEVVNTVEKISTIVSPYFIVIVGLYLYDDNFLFGTILILLGILSLVKFSWKNLNDFWERIKSFFGLNEES